MNNCRNCEHAIFDEEWGEFKCEVHKRTCTAYETKLGGCNNWKERKTNGTKQSTMADQS